MTAKMSGLLRLEAAFVTLLLALGLWTLSPEWWLVVLVLVLPDAAMVGYLANPQLGAKIYNAAHMVIGPVLLILFGYWKQSDLMLQIGLLWALHISFDRAMGYGLKYPEAFSATHLGRIGK